MAVAPVFIADMTTMLSLLRLSGTTQPDSLAMISAGVQHARIELYRRIGVAKMNVLLALPYTDNPTTEDQINRVKANNTELALTKIYLMRTMPVLFMDKAGAQREVWNQEGFTRRATSPELSTEIERLREDSDVWINELVAYNGVLQGAVSGGTICRRTPCDSPISISRSIQGGHLHEMEQYNTTFPWPYGQGQGGDY
jgi:hypothetical protein